MSLIFQIPSRMLLRVPMKYQLKPNQYTSAYNREMVVKLWPRYKESKNAMTRRNLWKLSKRFVQTLMIMASVKHFNATFLREIGVLQIRSIHWQSDLILTSILLLSTTRISTRNQCMTCWNKIVKFRTKLSLIDPKQVLAASWSMEICVLILSFIS